MEISNIRDKIRNLLNDYVRDWIKNNDKANILDYIEHQRKVKSEIDKELYRFSNKEIISKLKKEIENENKKK